MKNYLNILIIVIFIISAIISCKDNEGSIGKIEPTEINDRTLIGYSNKHTVRPGDEIEFKVSSFIDAEVSVQLVRVINGDSLSKYREHFKTEYIPSSFEGKIQVDNQELQLGSYIHIDNAEKLNSLKEFTIGAYFYPTFLPSEYSFPEKIDPFNPPSVDIATTLEYQTLFSRFNKSKKRGWALQLDKDGQLVFLQGNGNEIERYPFNIKIKTWDWSYIALSVNSEENKVTIHLMETPWGAGDKFTAQNLSATLQLKNELVQDKSLRFAALSQGEVEDGRTFAKPLDVYTGRIQDVRIFNKALSETAIQNLRSKELPNELVNAQVCYWDFSEGIGTDKIYDIGKLKLNGISVNIPERAVRGVFWDRKSNEWKDDLSGYNAIHFHADDLADAEWKTNFNYTVPQDLKSGIYAAKLTQAGFDEYITFFVAPPKNKPTAKIAFWMSNFNYLAYNNVSIGVYAANNYPGHNWNNSDNNFFEKNKTYATGGVYNKHVDGTYFSYGSRLRPDIHMKPNGIAVYNFVADTHISGFLEKMDYEYDVITDELLDKEGYDLLDDYALVITTTHPEYITMNEYLAVDKYLNEGGRLMYLGGNGFFWSIANHAVNPSVIESRNFSIAGERYLENGTRGGLMVESGVLPWSLTGVHMAGMVFAGSSSYTKTEQAKDPRASWIFDGTTEGDVFGAYGIDRVRGGAGGFEVDAINFSKGTPRNILVLAEAADYPGTVEDVLLHQLPLSVVYHPSEGEPITKAHMTFFETPKGGAVFTTGSIVWMGSTLENNYDNDVAIITKNVIDRFLDPTSFGETKQNELEKVNRNFGNPEYD